MSRHHDRIKNDPRWKAARLEVAHRLGLSRATLYRILKEGTR